MVGLCSACTPLAYGFGPPVGRCPSWWQGPRTTWLGLLFTSCLGPQRGASGTQVTGVQNGSIAGTEGITFHAGTGCKTGAQGWQAMARTTLTWTSHRPWRT